MSKMEKTYYEILAMSRAEMFEAIKNGEIDLDRFEDWCSEIRSEGYSEGVSDGEYYAKQDNP